MGNFSYIAKNTNEAVRNPWHGHSLCELQLLVNGEVVEKMRGVYNGYGSVLHDQPFVHEILRDGVWVDVTEETIARMATAGCSGDMWLTDEWVALVDLHFGDRRDSGFAIWSLYSMEQKVPYAVDRSDDDPDQGDIFPDEEDEDEEY